MMGTRFTWSLAVGAVAAPALAQDGQGVGTWLFDVTTQNGDAIVEPGETATVSLFLDMDPSVGEQLPDGSFLYAFAAANLDVLGGANAANGQILGWQYHYNLGDLYGDLTTTDGVNLYNTHAGQLAGAFTGPFTSANPIDVLTFEWQPLVAGHYDVAYSTESDADGPHTVKVWEFIDDEETLATYPVTEAAITFTVIPTPATAILLAAAGATRRRRRT
jgi:hypothetical protein